MGKGKRNRQFHYEDRQANPEKYQEKKKPFRMPKWATYTICVVLLLAIIVPIVISSLISGGTFLRARVLVDSKSGKYDLNQQMATFILWQNTYQSAYYEYYYMSWGLQEDKNGIVKEYQNKGGAAGYGIDIASTYTATFLREGLTDLSDYFTELVAGADAGVEAGLTLNKTDEKDVKEFSTWMENVYAASTYASYVSYDNFLSTMVGEGVQRKDIENAARLITMYTKYCNSTKLEMDDQPTQSVLQEYIEKNPSGHYEIKYHTYTNASETFMKKLYEKLGKTWNPDASAADKAAAAKDLNLDIKEFRKLVIESILEDDLKNLVIQNYLVKDIVTPDQKKIPTGDKVTDEALAEALNDLGITKATYTSDNKEINSDVSAWIFDSKSKAGSTSVITSGDSVYLVYLFTARIKDVEKSTDKTTVYKAEAGWKEYKYADVENDELKSFYGTDGLLFADLDAGSKTDATKDKYKSADELAKELYDKIIKTPAEWDNIDATELTSNTFTKPKDDSTTAHAIAKKIFGEKDLAVGKVYQVDDNGTSYVVKVTKEVKKGSEYTVSYTTHKDSNYYAIFRTLNSTFESAYKKDASTLVHPETTEKGSYQEWLCAGEYKNNDRTFNRVANDVAHFEVKDSNDKATGKYNVYVVDSAMAQKKDDTETVYGGYLLFNSKEEADKACDSINGLKGFTLWTAFSHMSVTKKTTDSTGKETENTTTATVETDLKKSDLDAKELQDWFFNKDREKDQVGVIKTSAGYYLVYFKSAEQTWTRTAKDSWVAKQMEEKLDQLVKDGGYTVDKANLEKIPATEVETSAETTTAATK